MAWWRRDRAHHRAPAGPSSAAPAAPAASASPPGPAAWRSLPPIQRAIGPAPHTFQTSELDAGLTTRRSPAFLEPLGHDVTDDGPSGAFEAITVSHPGSTAPLPEAVPHVASEPTVRTFGARPGSGLSGWTPVATPAPPTAAPAPVALQPLRETNLTQVAEPAPPSVVLPTFPAPTSDPSTDAAETDTGPAGAMVADAGAEPTASPAVPDATTVTSAETAPLLGERVPHAPDGGGEADPIAGPAGSGASMPPSATAGPGSTPVVSREALGAPGPRRAGLGAPLTGPPPGPTFAPPGPSVAPHGTVGRGRIGEPMAQVPMVAREAAAPASPAVAPADIPAPPVAPPAPPVVARAALGPTADLPVVALRAPLLGERPLESVLDGPEEVEASAAPDDARGGAASGGAAVRTSSFEPFGGGGATDPSTISGAPVGGPVVSRAIEPGVAPDSAALTVSRRPTLGEQPFHPVLDPGGIDAAPGGPGGPGPSFATPPTEAAPSPTWSAGPSFDPPASPTLVLPVVDRGPVPPTFGETGGVSAGPGGSPALAPTGPTAPASTTPVLSRSAIGSPVGARTTTGATATATFAPRAATAPSRGPSFATDTTRDAALATGRADVDEAGAVVFRYAEDGGGSSSPPPPVQRSAAGAGGSSPVVSRTVQVDEVSATPSGSASGASGPDDLESLANKLYPRIRDRWRNELRLDRERAGRGTDLVR